MAFGTVQIGPLAGTMETVSFDNGQTVQDALDAADLEVSDSESVKDSAGNPVALTERLRDGARYYITSNMKAGC